MNKVVIAIPRLADLHEVQDDHQVVMVREFEKAGYIIAVYDVENLEDAIEKAGTFKPYARDNCAIPEIINKFMYS
jgi:UDP-N-acetylglucosamine transferase subunit ALG13